jgi:MFS family permease
VASSARTPPLSVSSTFAAFRHRNYRLWFFGQLISMVGTWMQNTAQGYLVYTLTGSTAYLGYIGFISGLPSWLFMLYGGVVADRMSRRTMLIITQVGMMILAFVLAGLVVTNLVQPWHILTLAFLLGVAAAFDTPARQSFVVELVDRADITNAIALNGTMFNTGALAGPALAGIIYALTGPAWCFTINGISYLAVIAALLLMRLEPIPVQTGRVSALSAIMEGFRYVRSERMVATLTFSVFYLNVFGFGLMTLLPAWAVEVLGGDVRTNGLLMSARGVGAVLGGLSIAALSASGLRGKMWSISSMVLPLLILAFAATRILPLSLVLMAGMGFALIAIMNNSNAMVQARLPDALRGRIMGLYSLMFMGGGPLGALLVGVTAEATSLQFTALISALLVLVFAAAIYFFRPEVRKMK